MLMADESESRGKEELNDMNNARKEIHLKRGADTSNIFGYMNRNESELSTLAIIDLVERPGDNGKMSHITFIFKASLSFLYVQ